MASSHEITGVAVPAKVRYLKPEKKGTVPRINSKESRQENTVEEEVPVTEARSAMQRGDLSLDTNGFVLVRHETGCPDFRDREVVKRVYYPEVSDLVRRLTGATEVVVQSHLVRSEAPTGFNDGYARYAHIDYGVAYERFAPKILSSRTKLPLERAEKDYDYVFYNVWQPFDRPVQQFPLALLDARTLTYDEDIHDYYFMQNKGGTAHIVSSSPLHRWYYFPGMQTDEAVVFKQLDCRDQTGSRQCPHIAFWDTTAPAGALGRRSIEVRLLAAFPTNKKEGRSPGPAAKL